jgi:hypothetical protein
MADATVFADFQSNRWILLIDVAAFSVFEVTVWLQHLH